LETRRTARVRLFATTVALALGALGTVAWVPAKPDDTPTARSAPKLVPTGTYAVGRIDEDFVDASRPTKATRNFEGAPDRTLHTTIWYPVRGTPGVGVTEAAPPHRRRGPYPLIVYSHGNSSNGTAYEPMLRQWASAGYVIAAPDYPLSKKDAPGGGDISDVAEQPADARFVIDRVLASSARRSGTLSRLVDPKRVGASGHSLGAITTYRLAYETCCFDKRVRAAAPMSGVAGDAPRFFANISTPLLAAHGDSDGTLPYRAGADTFTKANPPKFFLTLRGGGHTPPYRGGSAPDAVAVTKVTLDFFDLYLKDDARALQQLRRDASASRVASLEEQGVVTGGEARRGR
jgi:dienelactone hydrolase